MFNDKINEKYVKEFKNYESLIKKILLSVNESDLKKLENNIYKNIDYLKKVEIEYARINNYLESHADDKLRYWEELYGLYSNYKACLQLKNNFSLDIFRKKIVAFDILFDINIGLYESLNDGYKYYVDELKKYKNKDYDSEENLIWKKTR